MNTFYYINGIQTNGQRQEMQRGSEVNVSTFQPKAPSHTPDLVVLPSTA